MKWTGLSAIACAAMLTVACAGDTRDRAEDENVSGTTGEQSDRYPADDSDVDEQARLSPGADDRSMVGTSGQAHGADGDARHFAQTAAMTSHAEVELGKLAVERAQSQDVKQFAQMMVRDHTRSGNELEQAVRPHNVDTSKELDQKHQQLMTRLRGLRGAEFDREYMKAMVEGHREVKSTLEMRTRDGRTTADDRRGATGTAGDRTSGAAATSGATGSTALDTAVNRWAAKALPTVTEHLERAEQIQSSLQNIGPNRGTTGSGSRNPADRGDDSKRNAPNYGTSRPAN